MAGHTPWTFGYVEDSSDWVVWGAEDKGGDPETTFTPAICTLSSSCGREEGRLISAAPELLAVASSPIVHLVECDEATVRLRIGGVDVCAFKQGDWRATALILFDAEQRAAIAKATGTSTLNGYEAEGGVNQASLPPQSEGSAA